MNFGDSYTPPWFYSDAGAAFTGGVTKQAPRPGYIDAGVVERPSWMPRPSITNVREVVGSDLVPA